MAEFQIRVTFRPWLRAALHVWRVVGWPLPNAWRKSVTLWLCHRGTLINGRDRRGRN
jgi:hypothetical protein